MSRRAYDELAAHLAGLGATQAPPPAAVQSSAPAPTMALSDIATALTAFQAEVAGTTINGATIADGVNWSKIKNDLTNATTGVFALALQVQDWFYQVQAMQTWQTEAQAYMTSAQANITACEAQLAAGSAPGAQPPAVVAAIAVGAVLFGGIVGFVGGRNARLGGTFRWTW